ncbi:MAG: AraC family ligand binding domain-containing protein, partial [Tannerella sp.]|nr:AraC family ligand binding domain-containing protein [Tannerella sp.]
MSSGKEKKSFSLYLVYSEEDEKAGMICTDIGYTEVKPNSDYPPDSLANHPEPFRGVATGRTIPEFQLQYISQGEGVFETEDNAYTVKPGSMMFVFPGQQHRYKPSIETGWIEYWVGFNGPVFSRLVQQGILTKEHNYLEIGLRDNIINTFTEIFDEVRAQRPLYQIKASSGIMSLLAEIITFGRRKDLPDYYQNIVEKAKVLMESNIYNGINLSDISKQLGISASRFNTIFKNYTSMSPYQYFIHI